MTRLGKVVLAGVLTFAAGAAVAADVVAADRTAQGSGSHRDGASAMRQFQKETLALRDELAAKRLDLEAEYDKAEPDAARVVALRKDIVELEGKIQASADRYGVGGWRGHGHGMMRGSYGWDGCGCGGCW